MQCADDGSGKTGERPSLGHVRVVLWADMMRSIGCLYDSTAEAECQYIYIGSPIDDVVGLCYIVYGMRARAQIGCAVSCAIGTGGRRNG